MNIHLTNLSHTYRGPKSETLLAIEDINLKIRMGDLEDAVNDYTQAIRITPDRAVVFYNRGIVKERMKDYAAAIRDYEKAASLSPEIASKAHQRIKFCRSRLHRK